mmetsp:Transcript_12309/g.31062  ORF Transcript_12309/g.31062 Transcript_12309/m.31062 type:complete len:255 (+) Transcript_12309:288-1052(+)
MSGLRAAPLHTRGHDSVRHHARRQRLQHCRGDLRRRRGAGHLHDLLLDDRLGWRNPAQLQIPSRAADRERAERQRACAVAGHRHCRRHPDRWLLGRLLGALQEREAWEAARVLVHQDRRAAAHPRHRRGARADRADLGSARLAHLRVRTVHAVVEVYYNLRRGAHLPPRDQGLRDGGDGGGRAEHRSRAGDHLVGLRGFAAAQFDAGGSDGVHALQPGLRHAHLHLPLLALRPVKSAKAGAWPEGVLLRLPARS